MSLCLFDVATCNMFWPRRTNHEAYPHVGEAVQHVRCNMRGGGCTVLTIGQDSNDDLVVAHFAKCIVVAVVRRPKSRFVVLFIRNSWAARNSASKAQIQSTV